MTPRTYTCAHCGGTFETGRSDEEANAEARENFGVAHASADPSMAVICDDCYRAFMAWLLDQRRT